MLLFVLLTSYVEIVLEAVMSIFFAYPDVGVVFDKYILSCGHKLADADPADTLDSWSGG